MSKCTNQKLEEFSLEHYTYINQIFGDMSVREIISEVCPNNKYSFALAESSDDDSEDDDSEDHHVLYQHFEKKGKKQKKSILICSVEDGYQDIQVDVNDTLCQSYSLLTYLGYKIRSDKKERQMQMIEMYRRLLSYEPFVKELSEEVIDNPENRKYWIDYTRHNEPFMVMKTQKILEEIEKTLETWKDYGYHYFIGDGTCPLISISKKSKK